MYTATKPPNVRDVFATEFEPGFRCTVGFLSSRGLNVDEAEEFAQAAWAKAWQRIDQLADQKALRPWVNTIAWRLVLSDHAKNRTEIVSEIPDPHVPHHALETWVELSQVLKLCSTEDKKLLQAHYLKGESSVEISRHSDLTPITARVRLHRIRRALRAAVTGDCKSGCEAAAEPATAMTHPPAAPDWTRAA